MRWSRFLLRVGLTAISMIVVAAGVLAATSAIALAIDWDIPEGRELNGAAVVFDRNGRRLGRIAAEVKFQPRKLADISPHLRNAVIATEDHRFYEHQGVDPVSVIRAVVNNVRSGGIREGGSTLTQQYVKNVYLDSDQSLYRKVREALISLQLEKERSKDEILEAYLNRAYFGHGAYGAEAAARTYFAKPASDLNVREAATLASILPAPSALSPRNDPRAARERRDIVLDEMAAAGFITAERRDRAASRRVRLAKPPKRKIREPYFMESVRGQLIEAYGDEAIYNGGLRVTTTLDLRRQRLLRRDVLRLLPSNRALDAGVAVIDPENGDVVATHSGRSFARSQVDLALGRGTDGRPSGSTFKVFALVTALEEGRELDVTYRAPGRITISGWSPRGNGGCGGSCTLLEATARSANTVYAQVAEEVGARDFTRMARRMGVRQRFRKPSLPEVLGTSDVTPLDIASAMATLANDGVACPARVIRQVQDDDGTKLRPPDPRQPTQRERQLILRDLRQDGYRFGHEDHGRCYRAVAPSIARKATQALEAVIDWGTGRRADIGRPVAGKTGTAQRNQEAWFAGYTPDLAMAVAFFNRDEQKPLTGVSGCGSVCYGGDLPAIIWREAALTLLDGVEPRAFPEPGPDERVFPDRRRLKDPITPVETEQPADEPAETEDTPTESPSPTEPTPSPSPEQQTPPPDGDDGGSGQDGGDSGDDQDDGGGLLPLPPPDS